MFSDKGRVLSLVELLLAYMISVYESTGTSTSAVFYPCDLLSLENVIDESVEYFSWILDRFCRIIPQTHDDVIKLANVGTAGKYKIQVELWR
jgi:hypothetical protein